MAALPRNAVQTVRLQLVVVQPDGSTRPLDPAELRQWEADRAARRHGEIRGWALLTLALLTGALGMLVVLRLAGAVTL